jgi:NAD(P)-dependent dehydrogenase (short-subunit alcohol dehydrogenase family)
MTGLSSNGRGRLSGKIALITGAGGGQGEAAALLFGREGATVGILDVDQEAAAALEATLLQAGVAAMAVRCDVSKSAEVEAAVETIVEEYGRIDILYNNAGIEVWGSVTELTEADWDRALSVNLKSIYLTSKAVIPRMLPTASGSIINTASIQALRAGRQFAAYAASKAAVVQLSRQMAVDFAPAIRVNVLCPGPIETGMLDRALQRHGGRGIESLSASIPMGRAGTAAEVALAALFFASDESSYITGAVLSVDGGISAQR